MATEKRLFVGGLFDGVEKDDLRERFSKFGSVVDVDVRKRLDDEGNPLKVFAYVNIKISDGNYNKCMQLYNKTKWRGREVQIQVAKESFIDRLQRERQAAELVSDKPRVEVAKETHEDVKKLQMKGAAPGTAIEGKQDWVVGKYGRPMPVVKIRRKDKKRVVKIDPSNYCHTIKKLEGDAKNVPQSVADLSWFSEDGKPVNGGSKSRRRKSSSSSSSSSSSESDDDSDSHSKIKKIKKDTATSKTQKTELSSSKTVVSKRRQKTETSSSESSSDESDHVRPSNKTSTVKSPTLNKRKDDYGFEVVSINPRINGNHMGSESDASDDTNELFSHRKNNKSGQSMSPAKVPSNLKTNFSSKKAKSPQVQKGHPEASSSSDSDSDEDQQSSGARKKLKKNETDSVSSSSKSNLPVSQSKQKTEDEADPYDTSDSETPADILRRMSSKGAEDAEGKKASAKTKEKVGLGEKKVAKWIGVQDDKGSETKKSELQKKPASPKKLKEAKENIAVKKSQNLTVKRILGGLAEKASKDEFYSGHELSGRKSDDSDDEEDDLLDLVASGQVGKLRKLAKDLEESGGKGKAASAKTEKNLVKTGKESNVKSMESQDAKEVGPGVKEKKKKAEKGIKTFQSKDEKHALANEKRLESLKLRQKEHLNHQKAIKVALASASVDQPEKNKKIVFDSDAEDDVGQSSSMMDTVGMEVEKPKVKKSLVTSESDSEEASSEEEEQSRSAKSKTGLFESDSESEDEDEDMFRIRPEKEGAVGRKLMAMQGRLGEDSRFKIDERFLEEEEEEEQGSEVKKMETNDAGDSMDTGEEKVTEEEKQKSMAILAGIVGSKVTQLAKRDKRRIYKDMAAIQYDPTKEGHEKMEISTEDVEPKKKKEKKKAEVIQKEKELELPEVSKDRYFTVTSSLKDVFAKDTGFSFNFAVNNKDSATMQAANASATSEKLEKKGDVMFPWLQSTKQFTYDSSDEEDIADEREDKNVSAAGEKNTKKKLNVGWSKETFFFTLTDPRIKESLEFFSQKGDTEKMREEWEEQRPSLIEAYRMKRKRALRKSHEADKARPWLKNKTSRRRNFHPVKRARRT